MRWTQAGALALLDRRAVRLNGDGDADWQFHRQRQHHRRYGPAALRPAHSEEQAVALAA